MFLALKWGGIKPFPKKTNNKNKQKQTKVTVERRKRMNVCLYRKIKKKKDLYKNIYVYTVKECIHMGTSDVLERSASHMRERERERKNGLRVEKCTGLIL